MLETAVEKSLKFMEEKLDEAVRMPSSQKQAVVDAARAMPTVHEFVKRTENATVAMLVCEQFTKDDWASWWGEFATLNRENFLERAYWLQREVSEFRAVFQNEQPPGERES
jgi:hypothetical protein